MSSPSLRSPAWMRWLTVLLVVAAVAIKLWRYETRGSHASAAAPPAGRAPAAAAAGDATQAFGPGVGFHSRERLADHFHKHGREVGAASASDYLHLAQALRDRPVGGDVLELRRADGVFCRFDRASGAFLAFDRSGVIRTYFRPNDGERYFERQSSRPADSP